jgi:ribonuclease BN (tRNA processing enzyme)
MKVKILGAHNTESSKTRHVCLLVDEVIALDAGSLTSTLSFEDQLKIKAVLLTHGHYDHIRDIPALAMNLSLRHSTLDVYTHQTVYNNLTRFLLNSELYPEFHKKPEDNPTLRIHLMDSNQKITIEGYNMRAIPMNHSIPTLGFEIISAHGKSVFYTGDTGSGLGQLWEQINPQTLFIEVTASDQWAEYSQKVGHLTPRLLREELLCFKEIKGYLPEVIAIHINPANENDIRSELADVARALDAQIRLGEEGMEVQVT